MSETVLKVLIDELTALRITCGSGGICKGVVEVPLTALAAQTAKPIFCPVCGGTIRNDAGQMGTPDGFADLARGVEELKKRKGAKIEFIVLPPS